MSKVFKITKVLDNEYLSSFIESSELVLEYKIGEVINAPEDTFGIFCCEKIGDIVGWMSVMNHKYSMAVLECETDSEIQKIRFDVGNFYSRMSLAYARDLYRSYLINTKIKENIITTDAVTVKSLKPVKVLWEGDTISEWRKHANNL